MCGTLIAIVSAGPAAHVWQPSGFVHQGLDLELCTFRMTKGMLTMVLLFPPFRRFVLIFSWLLALSWVPETEQEALIL